MLKHALGDDIATRQMDQEGRESNNYFSEVQTGSHNGEVRGPNHPGDRTQDAQNNYSDPEYVTVWVDEKQRYVCGLTRLRMKGETGADGGSGVEMRTR